MSKKSYTIEEIKKKKIKLESAFMKLIKDFETDTDVKVGYLNIERANDRDKATMTEEDRGEVANISFNLRVLDVI